MSTGTATIRSGRLGIALALSAAIHAAALAALLSYPDAELNAGASVRQVTNTDTATPGIEASDAVTVSWIGFSDPTPHAAPEAEADQAQVSPDAGVPSPVIADAAEQAVRAVERVEEQIRDLAERGAVLAEALRDTSIVARRRAEAIEAAQRVAEARERREQQQASRDDEPALPDEREAAAASATGDLVYRPGRPLAREGLEILTVLPNFDGATTVIELRSVRRELAVAISFAKDGSAREVTFVDGGSGFASVDGPIKNAAFRWRARGTDLDRLPADDPDAVVVVRIRFDL
ncbi:MAG: hypothetical protein AAFR96_00115 [Planctomycetota bacterium]